MIYLITIPLWDQFVGLMKYGLEFLATTTGSPGLAIIIFTVLIKLVLTPLNIRTIKSQREMQNLQPKIKALQKRYKDDRQQLSAETMRLYQEHNVNPMASCLPIVFQLPVFWGLYASLRALSTTGPFQEPFLWLNGHMVQAGAQVFGLGAPDPLHIMPFIAAFFQLIQTRMSMPTGKYKPTDSQQQMMTQLMQFMPITVIIFGWNFPSGLVLYWATQSVFGAVQQYFITGWGALREWLPFLPEVVRYTPPDPDAVDESALVARNPGERPAPKGGFWGAINKQMEKVEAQRVAQAQTAGDGAADTNGNGATKRSKDARVAVQNSAKARAARNGATAEATDGVEDDEPAAASVAPSPRISVRKSSANANGRGDR